MAPATASTPEKVLDRALEQQFLTSVPFVTWFLERTRFAGEPASVALTRSNWPWSRVKLRVWNSQSQSYDVISRDGETDLLVVFQSPQCGRFALHIENKLASGSFTAYQPELYRARAQGWAGKQKYGDYEEWETVLVAPTVFYERNQRDSRKFDRFISHEDVATHVEAFRVVAAAA